MGASGNPGVTLTDAAVRLWGTPVARDDQKSPEAHMRMKANMPGGPRSEPTSLTVQAKMWPTPTSHDHRSDGPGQQDRHAPGLRTVTTERDGSDGSPTADLNPRFVESLMGLPPGWLTPSTSVATDSFRSWLHTHSPNWRLVLESER